MGLNQMPVCRLFCANFSEVTLKSLRMIPRSVLYHYRVQSGEGQSLYEDCFRVCISEFRNWFKCCSCVFSSLMNLLQIIYCLIHASCMPVILIPVVLSGQVVSYDLTSKTYGTTMYCSLCDRFAGDSAIAAVTFEYCIQNLVAVTEDGNQEGKASGSTTGSTTTARQRISHAPSNKLHVHHCSALQFFCLHILFQLEQQVKDLLYIQFRGRERLLCLLSFCTGGAFTYVEGKEDRDMVDALKLILGALPTDVSIEDNCKSAVDHVVREYGRIDILVNNAAAQHYSTTLEAVAEAWLERLFRTNIFGYFFLTK
ncbi:hypothetical protein NC653_040939 [Populus alba x Populus x berolinensis]|uniref:Uncharacterized protein n=1 Tax=Populus alba x Populus x berolinensis TaxID=444605 RepID=A0AAD6L791_9ROSI|nr:hypothetical protein NC653_040939 [Populus alba x Populus x berolinensis]